jgi:hypothetical protein
MLSRAAAVLAVVGSAAAFSPMMSMDMGRREVILQRTTCVALAVAHFGEVQERRKFLLGGR